MDVERYIPLPATQREKLKGWGWGLGRGGILSAPARSTAQFMTALSVEGKLPFTVLRGDSTVLPWKGNGQFL